MTRGDVIDYVLGDGDDDERFDLRRAIAEDLDLAAEVAETRELFDEFRTLRTEPSGRMPLALRYRVLRRADLRAERPFDWRGAVVNAGRVAAVAAIWLLASQWLFAPGAATSSESAPELEAVARRAVAVAPDPELVELLDPDRLPVGTSTFRDSYRRLAAGPLPDVTSSWLSAENRLALLRREYLLRFSADAREQARSRTGTPDLDDRIEALARDVAALTDAALGRSELGDSELGDSGLGDSELGESTSGESALAVRSPAVGRSDLSAVAFGLRGLLAAGSTERFGPHQELVQRAVQRLMADLPQAPAEERATALLALAELAVVGGGELAQFVGVESDRLARETVRGLEHARPALLHWRTPAHVVADAGRLFQLSPAFGAHGGVALRARYMVASHMVERISTSREQPALVAAHLYGFGDLIDRERADRDLDLWGPRHLAGEFVAIHHLAWSRYPVRAGWAAFQHELLGLAALPTPEGLQDASALLLSLSMNSAAPGVMEVVGAL